MEKLFIYGKFWRGGVMEKYQVEALSRIGTVQVRGYQPLSWLSELLFLDGFNLQGYGRRDWQMKMEGSLSG